MSHRTLRRARQSSTLPVGGAPGNRCFYPEIKTLAVIDEMPPAAGNAMGLDRLVMLLADTSNIDDIVAFVPEEL